MINAREFILAAAVLMGPLAAHAAPAITNGSFETGDLTGWSGTATTDGFGYNPFGTTYGSGMDGTHWMWLSGQHERERTLAQTVSGLSIGTAYRISFIMASESGNSDQLNFSLDGGPQTLFTAPPITSTFWDNWVEKTYDFTASASSATLQFSSFGLNAAAFDVGLDNVRIAANGANPIPEPGSLALVGLGLAGLVLGKRRKL